MRQCLVCGASNLDESLILCPKCHNTLFSVKDDGTIDGVACPRCGAPLRFSHVDDAKTAWFICASCNEFTSRPKYVRGPPVRLSHINLIEEPQYAGKRVIVEAVISSSSVSYLVPSKVVCTIERKGDVTRFEGEVAADDPIIIGLVGASEQLRDTRLKHYFGLSGTCKFEIVSYRTVYRIKVRPPVFTLERRGEKIVDELGYEYKSFDVYVVSERQINFQPSSFIRIEGIPVPSPKTQQICLLAYRVEFPEEARVYDVEKLKALQQKFGGMSVKERFDWILNQFEVYSGLVGRRNLAAASFLTFFTPVWLKFNGDVQRGWGNTAILGDTTTGKSETLRKMIQLLGGGLLITAETASTVGLTGSATQIEREGWFVDWGFLVLQDRKLLAIDGAHKLSLANWAALAEAERSGVVVIAKAAKSSSYARTRQIKIANPIEKEASKYETKTMDGFLYPVQALATVFDKTSIARLDLAVFASQREVDPKDVNKPRNSLPDTELYLLSELLKWAWSGLVEVEFTAEATNEILDKATELYNTFFYDEIPLVSIDMKWKLARLSAALAFLTLSTDDIFSKVIVTKDHVDLIVEFISKEYSSVGLNILAQVEKHEILTPEETRGLISKIFVGSQGCVEENVLLEILRYIVHRGRVTRDELMSQFKLAEKNQLRPLLGSLSGEGLIEARRGLYPTPKLIQAYKVTNGFTMFPEKSGEGGGSN